jgi:hypothetical protein
MFTEEGLHFEARPLAWRLATAVVTGIWDETRPAGLAGSHALIVRLYMAAKDGAAAKA